MQDCEMDGFVCANYGQKYQKFYNTVLKIQNLRPNMYILSHMKTDEKI